MICRCGKYLSDNIIPNRHLHLLFADADVDQVMLLLKLKSQPLTVSSRSSRYEKANIQQRAALYNAATRILNCPNCGRLHVFYQPSQPATSYFLRLEKPLDVEFHVIMNSRIAGIA